MSRAPLGLAVAAVVAFGGAAALLGGWLLLAAGASQPAGCAPAASGQGVPSELLPIFQAASEAYGLGAEGPAVLAGLTKVESDFGRDLSVSSAGAVGWTQFLPSTWQAYGVDADGDGVRDPQDAADAIFSAANYLRHLGAPTDWRRALYGYNHDRQYVQTVLTDAGQFAAQLSAGTGASNAMACAASGSALAIGGVQRVFGGGRIVAIPGEPGMSVDERILGDVLALCAQFHCRVTAGYALTGHAADGEHPLGLAVDLVPGPGGSWDQIDALAKWAEPTQNHPRAPFRWVGYDGDPGHGRGNHLHLSWTHAPDPRRRPPAAWVDTLAVTTP